MKVRILKREDGGISVIYPSIKSRKSNETEGQWLERVFTKSNPGNLPYEDMDRSELPATREYRDGWEIEDKKIKVNKDRAEAVRLKNLSGPKK